MKTPKALRSYVKRLTYYPSLLKIEQSVMALYPNSIPTGTVSLLTKRVHAMIRNKFGHSTPPTVRDPNFTHLKSSHCEVGEFNCEVYPEAPRMLLTTELDQPFLERDGFIYVNVHYEEPSLVDTLIGIGLDPAEAEAIDACGLGEY